MYVLLLARGLCLLFCLFDKLGSWRAIGVSVRAVLRDSTTHVHTRYEKRTWIDLTGVDFDLNFNIYAL